MEGSAIEQYRECRSSLSQVVDRLCLESDRVRSLRLNFPELVCYRKWDRPVSGLRDVSMGSQHPYFSALHQLIHAIDQVQPPTEDLQRIGHCYRLFILAVAENPGEERMELVESRIPVRAMKTKMMSLSEAVIAGDILRVGELIAEGVDLEEADRDGIRPIHLAARHGGKLMLRRLVYLGADLRSITNIGLNALHICVERGSVDLVTFICSWLRDKQLKGIISEQDSDGKEPLHFAVWGEEKVAIVERLLNSGADPNAVNHFQYTAAHWAAKHGHLNSLKRLVKFGGKLGLKNRNGDLPIDLARRWGRGDVVHFLTGRGAPSSHSRACGSADAYLERFNDANRRGAVREMVANLIEIARCLHNEKKVSMGMYYACAALHLIELNRLEEGSERDAGLWLKRTVDSCLGDVFHLKAQLDLPLVMKWRNCLKESRKQAIRRMVLEDDLMEIPVRQFSEEIRRLSAEIIEWAVGMVGKPPCHWAFVSLGSLAREEMCLYSDLEGVILIPSWDKEFLAFFRKVAGVVVLLVRALGETGLPIIPTGDLPPNGFTVDHNIGRMLGTESIGISTPKALASYQEPNPGRHDPVAVNALASFSLLCGSMELVDLYGARVNRILDRGKGFLESTSKRRRERVRALIKATLGEFQPDFSVVKRSTRGFGIKQELLRPIQEGVWALSLLYGVKSRNTFERIEELRKRGVLSMTGSRNLATAYSNALKIRFAAHRYYDRECDIIIVPAVDHRVMEKDRGMFVASEWQVGAVRRVYLTLLPWCQALESFESSECRDKKPLTGDFVQKDFSVLVKAALDEEKWATAAEYCRQGLAVNPQSSSLHDLLESFIDHEIGQFDEHLEQVMDLWQIAAEFGIMRGRIKLIRCYFDGVGFAPNPQKAWQLLQEIPEAELGGEGLALMGSCYLEGIKVRKDVERAKNLLEASIALGDPRGMHTLGLYLKDLDPVRSDQLLSKAAENGLAPALFDQAVLRSSRGIPKSTAGGFLWWGRSVSFVREQSQEDLNGSMAVSAEGGDRRAQLFLAKRFFRQSNLPKAIKWGKRAAAQRLPAAQKWLGDRYARGEGVGRDDVEAKRLYDLAYKQKYAHASLALGKFHYEGRGLQKKNWSEAEKYLQEALKLGMKEALVYLGLIRFHRPDCASSGETAFSYFDQAATNESPMALYMKGKCLKRGVHGATMDPKAAFQCFQVSMDKEFTPAFFAVADCKRTGFGSNLDHRDLVWLYELGHRKGDIRCTRELGKLYMTGYLVRYNKQQAAVYLLKASQQGDADATYWYGHYLFFPGQSQSVKQAKEYYRLAARQKHRLALFMLGLCSMFDRDMEQAKEYLEKSETMLGYRILTMEPFLEDLTADKFGKVLEQCAAEGDLEAIYHLTGGGGPGNWNDHQGREDKEAFRKDYNQLLATGQEHVPLPPPRVYSLLQTCNIS